jgi:hypothetical protein
MFFIHSSNAAMLRLVVILTGKESLLPYPWSAVDPILIAFPLSLIVTILVTAFSKPDKNDDGVRHWKGARGRQHTF